MSETPGYCNYDEAWALLESIKDVRVNAFVTFGLMTAIARRNVKLEPHGSFDLLFLAEVLRSMYEDRQTMEVVESGDMAATKWWTDDE